MPLMKSASSNKRSFAYPVQYRHSDFDRGASIALMD